MEDLSPRLNEPSPSPEVAVTSSSKVESNNALSNFTISRFQRLLALRERYMRGERVMEVVLGP